jgi:NAD(P)-dependent dehydrogenase (short-subunit alcohol dehydrogenase family)
MSKTFLSISSGPGIGLATARRFGREGYRVVLAARNIARLQADAAVPTARPVSLYSFILVANSRSKSHLVARLHGPTSWSKWSWNSRIPFLCNQAVVGSSPSAGFKPASTLAHFFLQSSI